VDVSGGVETLTVTGASPGERLVVQDHGGAEVVTLVADEAGNAFVSFLPERPLVLDSPDRILECLVTGHPVPPGDYRVVPDAGAPVDVHVLALDEHPDPSILDQRLDAGYGYIRVRDGVTLSAMVRFPPEDLYGPPPWPTVVDYSGYTPSDPDTPQAATMLANLLGFAVVGVNMRGTGCSGGVFDLFSPAQAADGYDVVEVVARQPWVLHQHVGMVGLSYPGISQLYVAATRPPSLAAITPLSVIDDPWRQQWPGGVYNSGFTKAWVAARDEQTRAGGQSWDRRRIDEGDEIAADNQRIRTQNLDFERFGRTMENYRSVLDARRAGELVDRIEVPVYLTGAWQDEQTGSRFATMLERFGSSPEQRYHLFNGHHPDGFSPMVVTRWFEFLSFHVARRVPKLDELVRMLAPSQFEAVFGFTPELEADRFDHHEGDVESALAEYRSEPRVRILFENGAGHEVEGATAHRFEQSTTAFPPPGVRTRRWYLAGDGRLADHPDAEPSEASYEDDLGAGDLAYSMELLSDLNAFTLPQVPREWTRFEPHHRARFDSDPLEAPVLVAGAGHVDLWMRPGTRDTAVQVTITELRTDGWEQRVQCGWHRLQHAVELPSSDDHTVDYTFTVEDRVELVVGEWVHRRVPVHPVTHLFRPGSRIRVQLSTPGRDHPFWCFEPPVVAGAVQRVGTGGEHATSLVLPVWDEVPEYPEDLPPPSSLRGQPCRPIEDG